MKSEQKEALLRLPIVIIGWVLMDLWASVIVFASIIHWFYALFTAKRHKGLAKFSNLFITYMYNFARYATLTTNKRPFPWSEFGNPVENIDMNKKA